MSGGHGREGGVGVAIERDVAIDVILAVHRAKAVYRVVQP